jgi:DNA polymerase elongation subunit (family B)
MNKRIIEQFLIDKVGYLKKSQLEVAKALWRLDNKNIAKNKEELKKDLEQIKVVQQALRKASVIETSIHEQNLLDIYREIVQEKNKPKKVLFFDLEVSPNLVFSWGIGHKVSLNHENIVDERKIICVSWKFEGSNKVSSLEWKPNDDKDLVTKFAEIFNSADIVIGQNSDNFDIKWLRTRCLVHNVPLKVKVNSIDTLKMARQGFRFNTNRLDYMSKFIGNEGKKETSFGLWKDIVLYNDKKAMKTMVNYCENDIIILEQVYNKLKPYCKTKKFSYA